MEFKINYFEPVREAWREGYFIPIRNNFSHKLEREFLPEELKAAFEEQFGEDILTDEQFIQWYSEKRQEEIRQRKAKRSEEIQFE